MRSLGIPPRIPCTSFASRFSVLGIISRSARLPAWPPTGGQCSRKFEAADASGWDYFRPDANDPGVIRLSAARVRFLFLYALRTIFWVSPLKAVGMVGCHADR